MPETAMPIDKFFATVRPAYDDSWHEAFAALMDDPSDAYVIETLAEELRRDGKFRQPIQVHLYEGSMVVANGMHRAAASLLVGLPVITTTTDDLPDNDDPMIEVKALLCGPSLYDDDMERTLDAAWWLRSFPAKDGGWIESLHTAICDRAVSVIYDAADVERGLIAGLAQQAELGGFAIVLLSITPFTYDD